MGISTQVYENNRRFLLAVCYRMTGNAADAEDIVQETFVKALEKPPRDTTEPWRPWLLRVAVNLSRNQLRRRRQRGYQGPWLPSPIPTDDIELGLADGQRSVAEDCPSARYDMLESISIAFLIALEALTPSQRAVLLLRDVFDYSTKETAQALEMTEATAKVTLHRARRIMRDYDKKRINPGSASRELVERALERFLAYVQTNDLKGLEELLTEDVVAVTDGGGEVNAVRSPIRGRQRVLQFVIRWNQANRESVRPRQCDLNGMPAVLIERDQVKPGQATVITLHCDVDRSGRIRRLEYVLAPGKLTAITRESSGLPATNLL
jgi:RNA polymerase sigma factor (sigma-70 family)